MNIPEDFTKEEWGLAVSVIDFLPHNILVELCDKYEIRFEGGNKDTDDETLILGLFNHLSKEEILNIANKYNN